MEAWRWLAPNLALELTAQGYWANKWDSGRSEGGTVYDSQSGFETHWRVISPTLNGAGSRHLSA